LAFSSADDAQQAGREKEQNCGAMSKTGSAFFNFSSLRTAKPNSSLRKIKKAPPVIGVVVFY